MKEAEKARLSDEGLAFLNDPIMYAALTELAAEVGRTPEEYLLRFEEALSSNPEEIISIFEGEG